MIYAKGVYEALKEREAEIHLIISGNGGIVMKRELNIGEDYFSSSRVTLYKNSELCAGVASGSMDFDAMVIIPCSMATLAAVANGISANLIQRAADVCLKERKKLIVVPRETPLSTVQIRNMLKISESGGVVLPAMPGFYHNPKDLNELSAFVVFRVLRQMGIDGNVPGFRPFSPEEEKEK